MIFRRQRSHSAASDSGAAVLETAVVLPIILILMGGIYDFGRAYATMSAAQKSLRGAVRYLSLQPFGFVCSNTAKGNAKNLALYGNTAGTGNALVSGWQAADISVSVLDVNDAPITDCSSYPTVVKISMSSTKVPYNSLMWGIVGLPNAINMTVAHQERWIGQ
ncbi:MAG: TadE family protein [Hyphomicrobiales bacterium]|uniref:TadE/TadG family type IV pilus assembly protein n=1 Tax=Aestuariivirga sp. TaxID=2650926 RepID=UPI0035B0D267